MLLPASKRGKHEAERCDSTKVAVSFETRWIFVMTQDVCISHLKSRKTYLGCAMPQVLRTNDVHIQSKKPALPRPPPMAAKLRLHVRVGDERLALAVESDLTVGEYASSFASVTL